MGGNYRKRIRSKGSAHIKKGTACEINPEKNRYRKAAHTARNATMFGSQMIAVDEKTLADATINDINLDAISLGKDFPSDKSMISEDAMSRLSQFTSCTNTAFDAVHREWKSGSSMQTEVISVLAAVAELIKERNGNETDIEYFGALLTTLESSSLEDSSRTAATAYLLSLIIKKISKEILQSQFSKLTEVLYTKLLEHNGNNDGAVLKNLISTLGIVLRAQPASIWQFSTARNMVVSITALCTHDKPWVRTMSRRVVRAILTDPITAMENGLHSASAVVGQYIFQHLEDVLFSKNDAILAVRYLCLLEGVMHKMPSNLFKQLAETILKSFATADGMVKCSALQCLHRALQRQPCDAALSAETNSLLISALRQLSPPADDVAVCAYWMQALAEAHICLTAKDPPKGHNILKDTLDIFVKFFEFGHEQIAQITYQVISRIIEHCIEDNEEHSRYLLSRLDKTLTLQSALVWKFILRTQMKLFEVSREGIISPEFSKAMLTLAELRQSDECFCKQELDFTIGAAIRHVGAAAVLNVLPLGIDVDASILTTDFSRSWLIPILRVNLVNAPLSLFTGFFLTMAIKIHRRLPNLEPLQQRIYNTLQHQFWELLPAFCESPSDLEKSFHELAPVLGAALTERKDLRLTVLTSIRRVVKFALQPDSSGERIEAVSRYAKNFMPLLFNLYTSSTNEDEYDDRGVRLAILETIRLYVELTPQELIERFVDSAISKSKDAESSSESKQNRILDILCALSRSADAKTIGKVLSTINPWFICSSMGLQKKAYKILEEILARRSSAELEDLFVSREDDIEDALQRPYETILPSSRASVLASMRFIQAHCSNLEELLIFSKKHLDTIILSLDKANNTKTRTSASKLLQILCSRLIEIGKDNEKYASSVLSPILDKIFEITAAGIGESSITALTAARSTLVAMNIITQKYIKLLNGTHTSQIVSQACNYITDGRAPVRILAIRLIRVLVQKMPEFAVQQYRELVLNTVFCGQLTADLTNKVKKANRLLLEVLMDKFGIEILMKFTSKPEWVKQMKNIEKLKRRKDSKNKEEQNDEESQDDAMSGISKASSRKTAGADTILELLEDSDEENDDSEEEFENRSRVSSVWLKEDNEGETTDLLDRANMIGRLTTTDPVIIARRKAKALEKKKDNGFKFTAEGKIIILDDEEEIKRKRKRFDVFSDEDEPKSSKQKKEESDSSLISSDNESSDSKTETRSAVSKVSKSSGWRPGGKGIHRDIRKDGAKAKAKTVVGGKKVLPYTYLPLRQKGAKEDVRKILKAKRKSGKNQAKIVKLG